MWIVNVWVHSHLFTDQNGGLFNLTMYSDSFFHLINTTITTYNIDHPYIPDTTILNYVRYLPIDDHMHPFYTPRVDEGNTDWGYSRDSTVDLSDVSSSDTSRDSILYVYSDNDRDTPPAPPVLTFTAIYRNGYGLNEE